MVPPPGQRTVSPSLPAAGGFNSADLYTRSGSPYSYENPASGSGKEGADSSGGTKHKGGGRGVYSYGPIRSLALCLRQCPHSASTGTRLSE